MASTSTSGEGTVYALLGPNGAGKTTTVQILSTLIPADGGQVQVAGHDVGREPDAVRAAIGVTGQFSAVDKFLTGEENLVLMADLRHLGRSDGRRRAAELLEQFDLADAARKPVATWSGGMQRRLDLAMTLVGDPPDHLPRRADGGAGSALAPDDVGGDPRSRPGRGHDPPDDAVPRGGGPPRRPDRGPRPRPAGRRGVAVGAQAPGPGRTHPAGVRRRWRARSGGSPLPRRVTRRRGARPPAAGRRRRRIASIAARSAGGRVDRRRRPVGPHPRPR